MDGVGGQSRLPRPLGDGHRPIAERDGPDHLGLPAGTGHPDLVCRLPYLETRRHSMGARIQQAGVKFMDSINFPYVMDFPVDKSVLKNIKKILKIQIKTVN